MTTLESVNSQNTVFKSEGKSVLQTSNTFSLFGKAISAFAVVLFHCSLSLLPLIGSLLYVPRDNGQLLPLLECTPEIINNLF